MAGQIKPPMWCPGIVPVGSSLHNGLDSYWAFVEGGGTRIMDVSHNGLYATAVGGSWSAGPSGPTYLFDGTDDQVNTTSARPYADEYSPGFSFMVRYKRTSGTGFIGNVNDDWDEVGWCVYFRAAAGAHIAFTLTTVDGNDYIRMGNVDTNWHTLIGTYNGALMTLHLDGVSGGTQAQTDHVPSNGKIVRIADPFETGHYSNARFGGSVDVFAIWRRALSAGDIAELTANPYGLITMPDDLPLWVGAAASTPGAAVGNRRRRFFMGAA